MTHTISRMLDTHPAEATLDEQLLVDCLRACVECAQACTSCADACLSEEMVADLRGCIRLNLDCADVCEATARVLTRRTAFDAVLAQALLEACAVACRGCGDECSQHADMHEHCRVCADACRRCEEACDRLLVSFG